MTTHQKITAVADELDQLLARLNDIEKAIPEPEYDWAGGYLSNAVANVQNAYANLDNAVKALAHVDKS